MQDDVKKVFYFHTDANALGGFLENPRRPIPSQASVALAAVGGRATHRLHDLRFEDSIRCHATYTHVQGYPKKVNGPWVSRVISVVEGLDILGVVQADLAVARIHVEHPEDGGPPSFSFAGSHFRDLRIQGRDVTAVFNAQLTPPSSTIGRPYYYDEDAEVGPLLPWKTLYDVAETQSRALHAISNLPEWAKLRFGWVNPEAIHKAGYVVCSLVDKVDGDFKAQHWGHFVDIPDVGRFFLGEALVSRDTIQLTMVRAELGCKTSGAVSAGTARSNGQGYPPIGT